jgi:ribosomal protein S18 acetylase RimI-like enzyme
MQPEIPGVSFRKLLCEADYAAMAAVRAQCVVWDAIDPLSPEEALPAAAELAQAFPLANSNETERPLLLVEVDRHVIGYQTIRWWQHGAGTTYLHRGYLVPAWRGKGIGTAMLHWAERTVRAIAERHLGAKQLGAFVSDKEVEANKLLLNEGYEPVGGLTELAHDLRYLPHATTPDVFLLKPASPEQYRLLWEANEEVFSDEPQRSLPSEEGYRVFLSEPGVDPSLWSAAWVGEQVAGVAFCEITSHNVGVITQLSVRERWRRRSLGRALAVNALHALHDRHVRKVYVATDSGNFGALKLYENVGFRRTKVYIHYRKPLI